MPIFEYVCKSCDANFEKLVRAMSSAADDAKGEVPEMRIEQDRAGAERLCGEQRWSKILRELRRSHLRTVRRSSRIVCNVG